MASRKDINVSGYYVVSTNAMSFLVCILNSKKIERSDRIVFYIVFRIQRPSDTVF